MFPDNDIDFDWDEDEDERELARSSRRWEPADDQVEDLIDHADFEED
jgi:hypothetical protein